MTEARKQFDLDEVRRIARALDTSATSPGERFVRSPGWRSFDPTEYMDFGPSTVDVAGTTTAVRSAEEIATRGVTSPGGESIAGQNDRTVTPALTDARPARLLDAMTVIPTDSPHGIIEREETATSGDAASHDFASDPASTSTYPEFTVTFTRSESAEWTRVNVFGALKEANDEQAVRQVVDALVEQEVAQVIEDLALNADTAGGDDFDGFVTAAGTTVDRDTANNETRHSAIRRAVTVAQKASENEPLTLAIHPDDAEDQDLEVDADGEYLANAGILDDVLAQRVLTDKLTAGTAIVAPLSRSPLYLQSRGISVSAAESHSDWWTKGWLALAARAKVFQTTDADSIVKVTSL